MDRSVKKEMAEMNNDVETNGRNETRCRKRFPCEEAASGGDKMSSNKNGA